MVDRLQASGGVNVIHGLCESRIKQYLAHVRTKRFLACVMTTAKWGSIKQLFSSVPSSLSSSSMGSSYPILNLTKQLLKAQTISFIRLSKKRFSIFLIYF
jgi:hypothetical protein